MPFTRRDLWRLAVGTTLAAWTAAGRSTRRASAAAGPTTLSSDQVLGQLLEGNRRFVADAHFGPNRDPEQRTLVAGGQAPWAVVLSCIDSRVPPEIVFDQGLGDLFVARVAGNLVDPLLLGSIEYGIAVYSVPLVVVLGHQKCGAIADSMDAFNSGASLPGQIATIADTLRPAIVAAQKQDGDVVDNAVRTNIRLVTEQIRASDPVVRPAIQAGAVKVVGMYYSLDTGRVEIVDPA